jgi:segregation and condensation protein B
MSASLPEEEIIARIEAALYSAGRPLPLPEIIKASGSNSKRKTLKILQELMTKTKLTFKAIEICQLQDQSYVFQLKASYTPLARKFAQKPVISNATLKTLSYIAYEQPVTSKRLSQIRGSNVYSHLKELEHSSFICHERIGRLKIFKTTKKFQNYFGVNDLADLKKAVLIDK